MQGVDADYDAAEAAVNAREDDLKEHLKDVRRSLGGGREVCFVSVNKESHLIEVPAPCWFHSSSAAAAALAHARMEEDVPEKDVTSHMAAEVDQQ